MNKLATTLAGLALVAGASIAPAFAQGNFTANGPFVFSFVGTPGVAGSSFAVNNISAFFNPTSGGASVLGQLSLTNGKEVGTTSYYTGTSLSFTGGGTTIMDSGLTSIVTQNPMTGFFTITNAGTAPSGNTYVLANGAPVPEASTVISFGALLALGGLAVLRRKSVVKNAA